jgi:hypothetical protein
MIPASFSRASSIALIVCFRWERRPHQNRRVLRGGVGIGVYLKATKTGEDFFMAGREMMPDRGVSFVAPIWAPLAPRN